MKTFKELSIFLEKYYAPHEKLPSGRSPYEKAVRKAGEPTSLIIPIRAGEDPSKIDTSSFKISKSAQRRATQRGRLAKVERGANNPTFDTSPHPSLDVDTMHGHSGKHHVIHHEKTGITYQISDRGKNRREISWDHDYSETDPAKVIRNAKHVWKKHVEPRLPYGSIVMNSPVRNENDPSKNTRARVYKKFGFSEPDESGDQYAKVGRQPSSRQAAKGRGRLKPIKEYMLWLEKYYSPEDRLPSGKTPLGKYFAKRDKFGVKGQRDKEERMSQNFYKVRHGADNPEFNKYPSKEVEVSADVYNTNVTNVHHPESGITYGVQKVPQSDGKHTYNIMWYGNRVGEKPTKVIKSAKDVWTQHVEPRLPHGSIVHNSPIPNVNIFGGESRKNTRAKVYKKFGFSEVGKEGQQYAKVGRQPSKRQAAKGKRRITPYTPPTKISTGSDYDED